MADLMDAPWPLPMSGAAIVQGTLSAPAVLARVPQVWHTRIARRRSFLSEGDAQAYVQGATDWPQGEPGALGTPYATGWMDAEQMAADRDEARREAYLERMECER